MRVRDRTGENPKTEADETGEKSDKTGHLQECGTLRYVCRLKNKPSPDYVYQNYLKVAIHMNKSPKKQQGDSSFEEDYELTGEHSRSREARPKMSAETEKKYDDIFDAVVANAFMMDVKKTPEEFFAAKRRRQEMEEREAAGDFRANKSNPEAPKQKIDVEEEDEDVIVVTATKRTRVESPQKTLPVEEKVEKSFGCTCGSRFEQHSECHQHVHEEHGDEEFDVHCGACGQRAYEIRQNHVCPICGVFATQLEDHVASHYRNCTAKSAVMECRFCTKQFFTVREVMAHEQAKHLTKTVRKTKQFVRCNECFDSFENQELLSVHYGIHLDLNLLATKIAEMQYEVQAEKEECPFCRIHMSSRKTFRAHILRVHYPASKSISALQQPTVPRVEVKQESPELIETSEKFPEVKQEVKEEPHDDGYQAN